MKNIICLVVSLFALATTAFGIPDKIPFGKGVVTAALASVESGSILVYGNGLTEETRLNFRFSPVDSTTELKGIVNKQKPFVWVKNPLEPVNVYSSLRDKDGVVRLVARSSYRHVVKRGADGRKTYIVPRYAYNLYYEVPDQVVDIEGATSAVAVSADGNVYSFQVHNGKVYIPGFILSNPEYWTHVQVTMLNGGHVVQYDGSGQRLTENINLLKAEFVDVQSILHSELNDGLLQNTVSPQHGWNPVVEFENTEKQWVTIDLECSQIKARPTYVRIYTLDQERAGTKPAWIEYSPEESNDYREQLEVPLEPGTYFMEMEWPTWLTYEGGGKG